MGLSVVVGWAAGWAVVVAAAAAALLVLVLARPPVPVSRVHRAVLASADQNPPGAHPVGAHLGLLGAGTVPAAWRRHRSRAGAAARAEAVAEVCDAVAAELAAGRALDEALRAGIGWAPMPRPLGLDAALRALDAGGDVVAALHDGGAQPGAEGLAGMAACWAAASSSGSGLAVSLRRLAAALRAEQEHRRDVAAALAGPRATARILFVLPALGLLLGRALGAHPLATLAGSPLGLLCGVLGVGLDVVGLAWTAHLVRVAEQAT